MPNESESSEDIYIVTNRPIAQPLETIPETNPEPSNESLEPINNNPGVINENLGQINDNPEAINDNPGPINDNPEILNDNPAPINENPEPSDSVAKYPVEPIIGDENSNLKPENEGFTNRPEYENPELPLQPGTAGTSVPQPEGIEYPISGNPGGESSENPGYGYGQPGETKKGSTEESSEGYQIKVGYNYILNPKYWSPNP
ncbi:uncharacterized protein LOC134677822 [Cydia fagiglandana]|uniref:uncharacterized protein LOC134677822 n=1 Tax=Cydia fagiglandana TaxID=1458189 RepID=UPI002FEE38B8